MLLKDKIIFLTGGAGGIGYFCARAYAREGARVVIVDKCRECIDIILAELGDGHLGIDCDVSVGPAVKKAVDQTLHVYGRLDAIHNNAGIAHPSKMLHETFEDEWDNLMRVNLKSLYFTTKYGLPALIKSRGTILNTSSLVGEIGQQIHAAYTATKGGMNALTKSMALDYAVHHIRVNALAPAGVWTPMLRKWSNEQPDKATIEQYLNDIHLLGYCPDGDVIADAAVFLLSDKARFITGCILPVSGGAELGYKK
ncbi:SDR family NAD(P)-dependent oxidoreductase [Mucilaginibacter paludis]|uniref:Short-chain dehydrogenase/reductase SDR n=1 Tax=Mucilaginibacter paludis DSM 18603 TaxID=714943 RepID=H1Y951_9SPHI|nr:SDR family oxidoreductase [Mucilaginibacter paludis]EHQ29089.1 short-chain dehydrogenase/reductase SDR [Mucilaginibacter paludis DSM 18603]